MVGSDIVIDRLLAKHRNASPDLLTKLSFHEDKIIYENLVSNPAVTREILVRLGPIHKSALFSNPSLGIFLKKDKNIPFAFDGDGLNEILGSEMCPDVFVDWLVKFGSEENQAAYLARKDRRLSAIKNYLKASIQKL